MFLTLVGFVVPRWDNERKKYLDQEFGLIINAVDNLVEKQGKFNNITASLIAKKVKGVKPEIAAMDIGSSDDNSIWVYGLKENRLIDSDSAASSEKGIAICKTKDEFILCVKIDKLEISFVKVKSFDKVLVNNFFEKY